MSGFVFEQNQGHSVVRFEPILHEMSWGDVEKEAAGIAEKLKDASTGKLIVDLSPMELIQSGLVASMVRMWKATEEHAKRRVVVVAPHDIVKEVLRSAGLYKVFNVVDTREEASRSMGVSSPGHLKGGKTAVPVWCIGLVMLLIGGALGALAVSYLSGSDSDRGDPVEPSDSGTDNSGQLPEADQPDDEVAEPTPDHARSPLDGDGPLTVRGSRNKLNSRSDDTDNSTDAAEPADSAAENNSEAPPKSAFDDT